MKKFLFFVIILFASSVYAQEVLDKIAAVVDNEVIMKSEVDFRSSQVAAQRNLSSVDPGLKRQVLNAIIEEKLLYAQAVLDSVVVTDEEVNRRVDYQVDQFMAQFGSKEKVEQAYGMSVEKIKRELRENTRKSLMAQYLIQKKFGMIEASRREVEEFYREYRDSLGLLPEKYTIEHIFQNPRTSERVKKAARDFAQSLIDSVKAGADFGELAKKYSEDPGTAANGGDLGFSKRGRLVPEFEAAAFNLEPGQLSGVVETVFGMHVIQTLEKRGDAVHARHILIKVKNDEDADLKAIEFLSDLRDSVVRGLGKFETFAKRYSDDKETAKFGGLLGTFDIGQLDKNLVEEVSKLKSGDISYPKKIELQNGVSGYHIIYLVKKIPQHKADLEADYSEIKQLADYQKQDRLRGRWIDELKNRIFWEVRL